MKIEMMKIENEINAAEREIIQGRDDAPRSNFERLRSARGIVARSGVRAGRRRPGGVARQNRRYQNRRD